MRKIVFFIFFYTAMFGGINIDSFKSSFIQTVKNNESVIKYYGTLYFKKPLKVLWKYEKPVKKEIYILNDQVTIIEPEIEQVTISHFSNSKNIIDILKNAKKVDENLYIAIYNDQNFKIFLDKRKRLKKIVYKDKLDNLVTIEFIDPKMNIEIDDKIFKYKIDPQFDVIFE